MLIKAYAGSGSVHIINDVKNVVVHMHQFVTPENGPRLEGPDMPTTWRDLPRLGERPDDKYRFIDYTDEDGVRTRLRIEAYAYICNNEGRTIEKVVNEFIGTPPVTIRHGLRTRDELEHPDRKRYQDF